MSILNHNDLIFYKQDGQIISGGYSLNSALLKNGISPMQTFNSSQNGGKEDKVSSGFENLAIPAGLYYITQPTSKNHKHKYTDQKNYDKEHVPISDDIFDKLFQMIEYDDKRKRKTKKQIITNHSKNKKTKTKKHNP